MKTMIVLMAVMPMLLPGQQVCSSGSWFGLSRTVVVEAPEIPFVSSACWYLWMAEDLVSAGRNTPPDPVAHVPFVDVEDEYVKQDQARESKGLKEARDHR